MDEYILFYFFPTFSLTLRFSAGQARAKATQLAVADLLDRSETQSYNDGKIAIWSKPKNQGGTVLKYAILELLSRRPLTGYELKKRFDASITFFWHVEHSQIYSELKRLRKEGLAVCTIQQQDGRPNRKVYRITEKGLAELRAWLMKPTPLHQLKDEMMLRTFAFDLIDPEIARQQILRYKQLCEERLANYLSIWDKLQSRYGTIEQVTDLRLFCSYLTLTEGIMHERMYIDWCSWAADQLKYVIENKGRFRTQIDAHCVECFDSALYTQDEPLREQIGEPNNVLLRELQESKKSG